MNIEVIKSILPQTTFFIHGNLASNRWWYPSEQIWRKAAKGKNLSGSMILAEFKGCGKASDPESQDDVNMHKFAQQFIDYVKAQNLGPINLVGHSTGGLIAALMLSMAPELFHKAVLLDPVGAQGIRFDNSMIDAFAAMKNDKKLVATVLASTIHNCDQSSDFFQQIVVEDAFRGVQKVGIMVLQALDGLDIRQQISKIQNPVLVLHGEHDLLLPIEDSKKMAATMKNAEFRVVKNQGHCLNAEDPKQFVAICDQFLFA
jgi:3-oxoadipate enol-lactonase